jgi:transposase
MQSMFMLIKLLISIFQKNTTKKTNKNSSKPSSQTEKDESSTTHLGTNGRGKQESDAVASNTRTIETITVSRVLNVIFAARKTTYGSLCTLDPAPFFNGLST